MPQTRWWVKDINPKRNCCKKMSCASRSNLQHSGSDALNLKSNVGWETTMPKSRCRVGYPKPYNITMAGTLQTSYPKPKFNTGSKCRMGNSKFTLRTYGWNKSKPKRDKRCETVAVKPEPETLQQLEAFQWEIPSRETPNKVKVSSGPHQTAKTVVGGKPSTPQGNVERRCLWKPLNLTTQWQGCSKPRARCCLGNPIPENCKKP